MANVNWSQVGTDVTTAVKTILGNNWQTVSAGAGPQIQAMIAIGRTVEQQFQAGKFSRDEYQTLQSMQKNALEGILSGYEAVGIVVAEQAAAAAWSVVAKALSAAGVALV